MNKIFFQIEVRSGSFETLTGIRRNIKPQIRTQNPPMHGFATSKVQTRCGSLRRKLQVYSRVNRFCSCEAESCAVVEIEGTLLFRIEGDAKRFVNLAALDSALIFFSSYWSSLSKACLVFSKSLLWRAILASSTASLIALLALYCSSLLFSLN